MVIQSCLNDVDICNNYTCFILCRGDCIISIDGRKVRSRKDIVGVLYEKGLTIGAAVEVVVLRE